MIRLLLPLFFCLTAVKSWSQSPLQYTISPDLEASVPKVDIILRFDAGGKNETHLEYQDNQFGEPDQMRFLNFPVQKSGITVEKVPDSNFIRVKHSAKGLVEVAYSVVDMQGGQTFYNYCCYNPIIHHNYFHIQSGHLLPEPDDYWSNPDDRKEVVFEFAGLPENFVFHHSFGAQKRSVVAVTNSAFNSAVFVGGDYRKHQFMVEGRPVYFLVRGSWQAPVTEDTLVDLLKKTVAGHRTFWRDYSDSIYSVFLLPVEDPNTWTETSKSVSLGGSGLTNSFLSYATNNPGLDLDRMRYVYVHELMHHWIGIKIQNAEEEKQYWFSEGFTDYFTLKNSLRYGLIDVYGFLKGLNDDFAIPHSVSPYREAPNDSVNYQNFWSGDRQWEKLPYQRGCLYAFHLDNQIRARSKGKHNLDDMMRDILETIQKHPKQKLTHQFFKKKLKKYAGKSAAQSFERYIEKGQMIDFSQTALPEGMTVSTKDITMRHGPSPEIVTRTEVLKNCLFFEKKAEIETTILKLSLLR